MPTVIEEYTGQFHKNDHRRYLSWEHCFQAFQNITDKNLLSLHLAFYLASWGMYRGSCGLLQKDYLVHLEAVEIIQGYKDLLCSGPDQEVSNKNIIRIEELCGKLKDYYGSIKFIKNGEEKEINPTITLISKVLMGTLGCLPAMDRYFLLGLSKMKNLTFNSLSEKNLTKLIDLIDVRSSNNLSEQQNFINNSRPLYYPKMKVLDMYYWQIGYNLDMTNNAKKELE